MQNLSNIRDHIISTEKNEVKDLILIQDLINLTWLSVESIISLSEKITKLNIKSNVVLNVIDFDDTIYSRFNQLQLPILQDNRWLEWNKVIRKIWIDKYVDNFYKKTCSVIKMLKILENQNSNHKSIILTAWEEDLQRLKCRAIWINWNKPKISVVKESKSKPLKLLIDILELGYIPWKIIIYEDRPEIFLWNNWKTLAKMLWIEIVVDHVFLDQNDTTQISEIRQNIFKN
jgi:hypothetical protein